MSKQLIQANPSRIKSIDGIDKDRSLKISEYFFDTIQGEGVSTGVPAAFLRLTDCTLNCVFCDSSSVWKYGNLYSFDELFQMMEESGLVEQLRNEVHFVLTGGSPLRQQKQLVDFLIEFFNKYKFIPFIEIENEGVLKPNPSITLIINQWNNSPKLANSGMKELVRYKPEVIKQLSKLNNSWFKFVVETDENWDEINNFYLKPGGKLLYLSSSEVYSGLPYPPFSENQIGNTSPSHPRACYIEGKKCGETICMAARRKGIDAKIARVSLVYGDGTKKGDSRVLNQFIEQALTNKRIELRDSGTAKRTYCYISDAVKMMWKILLDGKSDIYNLGGFSTVTIAELARIIGKLTDSEVIIPKNVQNGMVGAPKDVRLDMNKVLNEFDMKIEDFVDLKDGLKTITLSKAFSLIYFSVSIL